MVFSKELIGLFESRFFLAVKGTKGDPLYS
jgi:hypothetical protein